MGDGKVDSGKHYCTLQFCTNKDKALEEGNGNITSPCTVRAGAARP